jgi:hypothetical protein
LSHGTDQLLEQSLSFRNFQQYFWFEDLLSMHSGEISFCSRPHFCFWQCTSGYFCASTGLLEPEGPCSPGHYCSHGANSSIPTDGVTGGLCGGGHVSHFVNFPLLLLILFSGLHRRSHPSLSHQWDRWLYLSCFHSVSSWFVRARGMSSWHLQPHRGRSILSRLSIWILVPRKHDLSRDLSSPPLLSHQIWRSNSLPQWNLRSC